MNLLYHQLKRHLKGNLSNPERNVCYSGPIHVLKLLISHSVSAHTCNFITLSAPLLYARHPAMVKPVD